MKQIAKLVGSALLVMGSSAAFADVQIYGTIGAGLDVVKTSDVGLTEGLTQSKVEDSGSFIGFKGSEDLGNGLKAVWQVEQSFRADTGSNKDDSVSGFGTRNTFVGVKGDFGTVKLGKHDSAYKLVGGELLPLADTTADNGGLWGRADARLSNVVVYHSPVVAGFSGSASYAMGEDGSAATKSSHIVSLSGSYDVVENVKLSAAYQKKTRPETGVDNQQAYKLVATYSVDAFSVGVGFERVSEKTTLGSKAHQDGYTVAGSYKLADRTNLLASYSLVKSESGDSVTAETGANQVVLGASYDLSKRTQVLGYYSKVTNKENASFNFGTNSVTGLVNGQDAQVIGVSLRHSF